MRPVSFKNFWHAHNALTDPKFREPYLKLAESQGILGITIANNGPSSIAAIKPIPLVRGGCERRA